MYFFAQIKIKCQEKRAAARLDKDGHRCTGDEISLQKSVAGYDIAAGKKLTHYYTSAFNPFAARKRNRVQYKLNIQSKCKRLEQGVMFSS